LNRSRLEIDGDKLQALAGLGGDPVRDVVLQAICGKKPGLEPNSISFTLLRNPAVILRQSAC